MVTPSALNSAWTRAAPQVPREAAWIAGILRVRSSAAVVRAEAGSPRFGRPVTLDLQFERRKSPDLTEAVELELIRFREDPCRQ